MVYCNCDDPRVSKFFHYFSYNFEFLGLKKLIATCYQNQNIDLFSKNDSKQAIYLEYSGDQNGNRVPDLEEIEIKHLKGDGDFRNPECIELLKQADVVVTNPPFSLFREYVAQLIEYDKKFLIVGALNAIKYKEFFPFIKDNKVWQGYSNGGKWFRVPDEYEIKSESAQKIVDGNKYFKLGNVVWYTNLETKKRYEDIILHKKYSPEEYPKYLNCNAINVDKVKDIPCDYNGVMGVPITFIDKYNPEQFKIVDNLNAGGTLKEGNSTYARILIKRK